MAKLPYLLLMLFAGCMIGFQSPVNALLSRKVGILESSLLSFVGGTLALAVIVLIFGKGNIGGALKVPWWQLIGGLLGAIVVVNTVICVPELGVLTTLTAMIFGNLVIGATIDHFGWFGVPAVPFGWQRLTGFALMLAGILVAFKK